VLCGDLPATALFVDRDSLGVYRTGPTAPHAADQCIRCMAALQDGPGVLADS